MKIARLTAWACTLAGAALLTGCVVAPADGAYYTGDAYSTYSTSGYGYGYGGYPYPYYGGSSLVIQSSPSYIYRDNYPHYRPNYSRPSYGGRPNQGNRPSYVSPGAGSNLGRPSHDARPPSVGRPSNPGGGRAPGYQQVKPRQWER